MKALSVVGAVASGVAFAVVLFRLYKESSAYRRRLQRHAEEIESRYYVKVGEGFVCDWCGRHESDWRDHVCEARV